jgi:hypothetical protein
MMQHPAVRQLALDLIQRKQRLDDAVALLARNYASGDDLIIQSMLEQPASDNESHSLGYDTLRVFEENEMSDAAASLLHIYPSSLAFLLSRMRRPDLPEPLGVFREVEQERYVSIVRAQLAKAKETEGEGDIQKLISGRETWTVT